MTRPKITPSKRLTWDWQGIQDISSDTTYCIELADNEVNFLLSIFNTAIWSTRWLNQPPDFQEVLHFLSGVQDKLMLAKECGISPEDCPTCGKRHKRKEIGNFQIEETCMGDIIINNCCCGGGSGSGSGSGTGVFSGGTSSGGGASGSWISEPDKVVPVVEQGITQCDIAAGLVEYVAQQSKEFALFADNNSDNLSDIIDGLINGTIGAVPVLGTPGAQVVDWVTDVVEAGTGGLLELTGDSDFLLELQTAWMKEHGERGRIQSVTRDDFLAIIKHLPRFWTVAAAGGFGVVFPRVVYDGFFRIMNMTKINSRLPLARGTASDALCEFLTAQAGITPENYGEPGTVPVPPTLVGTSGAYEVYKIAEHNVIPTRIIAEGDFNLSGLDTSQIQAVGSSWEHAGTGNWFVRLRVKSLETTTVDEHVETQQFDPVGVEVLHTRFSDAGANTALRNVVSANDGGSQALTSNAGLIPTTTDYEAQGGDAVIRWYVCVNTAA